jgi:hypothetical protein
LLTLAANFRMTVHSQLLFVGATPLDVEASQRHFHISNYSTLCMKGVC